MQDVPAVEGDGVGDPQLPLTRPSKSGAKSTSGSAAPSPSSGISTIAGGYPYRRSASAKTRLESAAISAGTG